MAFLTFLNGYKSYFAVAGFIGLAIYQVSTGQYLQAIQSIMAAIAVAGMHADITQTNS